MTDPNPSTQQESHNRRNQLPAGVTVVHLKYRVAALRIRAGGAIALRTDRDGPWDPVRVVSVGRALRPWVIKIQLVDGSHLYLRPCLPGEAAITECGRSIGGIADTEKLGDDPVSGVIAVLGIAFYVLASPFFLVSNWRRTRMAARLRGELSRS